MNPIYILVHLRAPKPDVKGKKISKPVSQPAPKAKPAETPPEPKPILLINDGNFMERFRQMQGLKTNTTPGLYR